MTSSLFLDGKLRQRIAFCIEFAVDLCDQVVGRLTTFRTAALLVVLERLSGSASLLVDQRLILLLNIESNALDDVVSPQGGELRLRLRNLSIKDLLLDTNAQLDPVALQLEQPQRERINLRLGIARVRVDLGLNVTGTNLGQLLVELPEFLFQAVGEPLGGSERRCELLQPTSSLVEPLVDRDGGRRQALELPVERIKRRIQRADRIARLGDVRVEL